MLPSTLPSRQQLLVAELGRGCRAATASRGFFGGTKGGSVCTQQSGQMLGMGAAIQGKARRGSDSGLTLLQPRWRDQCPSAEQHHYRAPGGGEGGTQLSVQPFLSQRRRQGFWKGCREPAGCIKPLWMFAKGTEGNTNSLKAEGLQLLLKVAPSYTLPHILSA